jgi:muramoyltetrapeptide carboxypeptidase
VNKRRNIRIIEPAGRPDRATLERNIADLERRGFTVQYTATTPDPDWAYASGTVTARCLALEQALFDEHCEYIVAARGGYGCSDLLPLLDWERLHTVSPKCVVGLSDICALHVALFTRLGWRGLHAVMPGGSLWQTGSAHTEHLLTLLGNGLPWKETLAVRLAGEDSTAQAVEGVLLGGCLAVLTNLIGTPYLPHSLAGSILFIEDINENPGRLLRFWNQWTQCGLLEGLSAVLVGQLQGVSEREEVLAQLAQRTPCPVYATELFGHQPPSFAIGQGASARIGGDTLHWEIDELSP